MWLRARRVEKDEDVHDTVLHTCLHHGPSDTSLVSDGFDLNRDHTAVPLHENVDRLGISDCQTDALAKAVEFARDEILTAKVR